MGDKVLDLVISYIHDTQDHNSLSLVSRKFYELDGITRKRLTVHVLYYPNPASLIKRFPFIESLTLKGPPSRFIRRFNHHIKITPWIKQLALEFRCLKELHIRCMVVNDEDLETLAIKRGKDLRSLKIKKCEGISTKGLMHVSKYCNQLRTLCFDGLNDRIWLRQLALNNMFLESLHVTNTNISNAEDLIILLAKNCCNSLISLKIGQCYLSKLGDAFRYAVRLEQFGGGYIFDKESELVGFQFPPNLRSLSRMYMPGTQYSSVLPLLNQISKLKLLFTDLDEEKQCLFFKRCPNLEILSTNSGDRGLHVLGQFCKKLRKVANYGLVSHLGMIALAKGCTNLECFDVYLRDISNKALECVGTHLKNLRKFRIWLSKEDGIIDLSLDNGVKAMLMGCNKLENVHITLRQEGLTDVGLEYIEKYGANLRSLSLTLIGNSNAGPIKLAEGCLKLRKLKLKGFHFSEQSSVFTIPSLRYVWSYDSDFTVLALIRPEYQL